MHYSENGNKQPKMTRTGQTTDGIGLKRSERDRSARYGTGLSTGWPVISNIGHDYRSTRYRIGLSYGRPARYRTGL